jgi:hypothetical protein
LDFCRDISVTDSLIIFLSRKTIVD